jgi:hypothetical protein
MRRDPGGGSLPPGIGRGAGHADARRMTAAVLAEVALAGSIRLLADVRALGEHPFANRDSAALRLEAALGRDFADCLVTALSERGDASAESPPPR